MQGEDGGWGGCQSRERQLAVGQEITSAKPTSEFGLEGPGGLHEEDHENFKMNRQARSTENQPWNSSVAQ